MLILFLWAEFAIFFKLQHHLGFAPGSGAVTVSWWLLVAGATLSHCIDLAVPEWQSGVLTPSIAQHHRVVGPFASEFMARAGATGSPWEK